MHHPLLKRRFKPLDISIAVFLAGCVPSILMALVSYSILSGTLDNKIVFDRHTLAESLASLIDSDIRRTADVVEYYQNLPLTQNMVLRPYGDAAVQDWLVDAFYAHPQIDGMFVTDAAGKLIASIPATLDSPGRDFSSKSWLAQAAKKDGAFISGLERRVPDGRPATIIAAAIRKRSGEIIGFVGANVLVERLGKRLSALDYGEQSRPQVIDQSGVPFFGADFRANDGSRKADADLLTALSKCPAHHLMHGDDFITFAKLDTIGWTATLTQPAAVAYKPEHDLIAKATVIEAWFIIGSIAAAWIVSRLYTQQFEANERVARETFFNEKILANMPVGIALIDPTSQKILQANQSFVEMAQTFGGVGAAREITDLTFPDIKLGAETMLPNVVETGAPFLAREQRVAGSDGREHFLTINLLRLQDAELHTHGILFLIEDNTTDITIRKELIAANTAKDQFLALLSHELRNPLSPVITMVHELEKISEGDERISNSLEVIRRNVELEARLIDDLLDITRIAHGKLQLTPEVVNAHRSVHRALEICQHDIELKKLETEVRLEAREHFVKADPARFQQALWNLIKNAVKFTEHGKITITSRNTADRRLVIEVRDTGIGIEPERLRKIFNAFEQGESSITRRFGGLGLGLAISKAMIEAHGGKLTASSAGAGLGSTFCIEVGTVDGASTPDTVNKTPTLAGNTLQHKILLVDDHEDTCLGMKLLLERRGYRVQIAHTIGKALELAEREKFELLISDLGLPDGTGFDLMEKLRGQGLRGIALSGFGMESDIERSREAGFSEHMIKPINLERLDSILKKVFSE